MKYQAGPPRVFMGPVAKSTPAPLVGGPGIRFIILMMLLHIQMQMV